MRTRMKLCAALGLLLGLGAAYYVEQNPRKAIFHEGHYLVWRKEKVDVAMDLSINSGGREIPNPSLRGGIPLGGSWHRLHGRSQLESWNGTDPDGPWVAGPLKITESLTTTVTLPENFDWNCEP